MKKIKLGYEIPSGKIINIPLSHLIVTGITQESGKMKKTKELKWQMKIGDFSC